MIKKGERIDFEYTEKINEIISNGNSKKIRSYHFFGNLNGRYYQVLLYLKRVEENPKEFIESVYNFIKENFSCYAIRESFSYYYPTFIIYIKEDEVDKVKELLKFENDIKTSNDLLIFSIHPHWSPRLYKRIGKFIFISRKPLKDLENCVPIP